MLAMVMACTCLGFASNGLPHQPHQQVPSSDSVHNGLTSTAACTSMSAVACCQVMLLLPSVSCHSANNRDRTLSACQAFHPAN